MSPQIAIGEWAPDNPRIGLAPDLSVCKNLMPVEIGYGSFPTFVPLTIGTTDAMCKGAASGRERDDTEYLIAGDATKLYSSVGASLTRLGATTYTTGTKDVWRFCQYGNRVIAVNYADAPQMWDFSAACIDLSANASKARYCAVVRKFVVLGNIIGRGAVNSGAIGTLPEGIHWSSYDNSTYWPDVQTADARANQSDFQPLPGVGGAVQGVLGGLDYGVIFQERAITRLEYVGGDLGFQTHPIERGRGALIPGSIVGVGALAFYCSEDGFWMFDGVQSSPIGLGKIDRTILADMDQGNYHLWSSEIIPQSGIVIWLYPSSTANGIPNKLLLYNYKVKKWATVDFSGDTLVRSTEAGLILDNYGASMDAPPMDMSDLDTFGPAARPTPIGAFNSSHTPGAFSGYGMACTIETGDTEISPGRISVVHGIRPVYDPKDGGSVLLAVRSGSRFKPSSAVTYGNYSLPNDVGICPQRSAGRYHRMGLSSFGDFERLYAFDVDATDSGRR